MYDVIDGNDDIDNCPFLTTELMRGQMVHMSPTVGMCGGDTRRNQIKAPHHSNSIVIHSQTQAGNGVSLNWWAQPIDGFSPEGILLWLQNCPRSSGYMLQ